MAPKCSRDSSTCDFSPENRVEAQVNEEPLAVSTAARNESTAVEVGGIVVGVSDLWKVFDEEAAARKSLANGAEWERETALCGDRATSANTAPPTYLELVGMSGRQNAYPDELSRGQQQRIGRVRAPVLDPDILLMDEPFSTLDALIREDLRLELLSLRERLHSTIVFITHDVDDARARGNQIDVLDRGRLSAPCATSTSSTPPVSDHRRTRLTRTSRRSASMQAALSPKRWCCRAEKAATSEQRQRGLS